MPFYSYILGIQRFIAIFLVTNVFLCQAVEFESMGKPGAQLGGIWVQNLANDVKNIHFDMVKQELDLSKDKDTNIALFVLSARLKNGKIQVLLDAKHPFRSGGFMLTDPQKQEMRHVSEDRARCLDGVKAIEEKLKAARQKVGSFPGDALKMAERGESLGAGQVLTQLLDVVQRVVGDKKQKEQEIETLRTQEEEYAPKLFSADPKKYDGYLNSVYDPEQTIARIVDHYIRNMDIDHLVCARQIPIEKGNIDCFILNLHSRTDMCPFCLMYLTSCVQNWVRKLGGIPFVTIVSSRQEYRCDYPFIKEKTYYRGYSMRSIGWGRNRENDDDGSSFDGLKKISAEQLVIQYVFQSGEIYGLIGDTDYAAATYNSYKGDSS